MAELIVGVRDLKAHLSEYLRKVQEGQVVVITEHGKTVGRIVPESEDVEARVKALVKAGVVAWNGKKLRDIEPTAVNRGDKLASDIVIELRE